MFAPKRAHRIDLGSSPDLMSAPSTIISNDTSSLRKIPIPKLLFDIVEDEGPLPYGWEPNAALASFESTCHKLRRFLELLSH